MPTRIPCTPIRNGERMAQQIRRLTAEPEVVEELRRRSRSTIISMRDRERAEITVLRLEGLGVDAVAARLNTTPKRVSLWSRRFASGGLAGLKDRPGRGRKLSIPAATVARVVSEVRNLRSALVEKTGSSAELTAAGDRSASARRGKMPAAV